MDIGLFAYFDCCELSCYKHLYAKKKRQEGKVVWSETGEVTEGINGDRRRVDFGW